MSVSKTLSSSRPDEAMTGRTASGAKKRADKHNMTSPRGSKRRHGKRMGRK